MKIFRRIIGLLVASALSAALVLAWQPADWRPLEEIDPTQPPAPPLVGAILAATNKRTAPLTLSEARINEYLRQRVKTAPNLAAAAQWITGKPPTIALEKDHAQLRLRWLIGDTLPQDVSVRFSVYRHREKFFVEIIDGAYGRLQVPRGLLWPINPAMQSLADALEEEIEAVFEMNQMSFEPKKVVLDPRF